MYEDEEASLCQGEEKRGHPSPQSNGGPPHENRGPPWVRLDGPETPLLLSLQTETSTENLKGNGSTESKMAKQGHWVTGCKNGGQTKTEAMDGHLENSGSIKSPLYLLHSLSSSVAEQATTTLALCLLRGSHCTTSCCSKMYKYVQRCTSMFKDVQSCSKT